MPESKQVPALLFALLTLAAGLSSAALSPQDAKSPSAGSQPSQAHGKGGKPAGSLSKEILAGREHAGGAGGARGGARGGAGAARSGGTSRTAAVGGSKSSGSKSGGSKSGGSKSGSSKSGSSKSGSSKSGAHAPTPHAGGGDKK